MEGNHTMLKIVWHLLYFKILNIVSTSIDMPVLCVVHYEIDVVITLQKA